MNNIKMQLFCFFIHVNITDTNFDVSVFNTTEILLSNIW